MSYSKVLVRCAVCDTRFYLGQFDNIDCPNCHGDPEKVNMLNEEFENCLCKECFTIWKQRSDEKPECPTCKK